MQTPQRWFIDKPEGFVFLLFLLIGFVSSILTFHLLDGYAFNAGKNLIGAFLPPFLCVCYSAFVGYRHGFSSTLFGKTLLLYLLQIIPFLPLFFQVFQPTAYDDFYRYHLYAKNIVAQRTFWGGDRLYFPDTGYAYATQPGYRYFIAAQLLIFKSLYRFTQFFNITLLIAATFFLQKAVRKVVLSYSIQVILLIITILFTPYATKNLLMGLSEWLTAALLMIACFLYTHKKNLFLCMFVLGLVPFFRQNLTPGVLLLASAIVFVEPRKALLILALLLPLLLPVYHNFYYAGEWRFLVKLFATPLLNDEKTGGVNFWVLFQNLWRLIGFEWSNNKANFDLLGFIFLPISCICYFALILQFQRLSQKFFFVLATVVAILPGLFLGKDYYPRFEYVSVVFILSCFCLLSETFRQNQAHMKF